MEVWLPPGYTNIFPPNGIAGKKNDSKVPKGLRDMWSFLPEGAHWSVLKSLHPMNMNGWTFKSPLFWDPEKSSKEPIHLLPRLGVPWKTCQFSGGCIGFNPLGASWRVTIWPPTPGEKASCFCRCVGDAFGAELHRELQHLAVPLFFLGGGWHR